MDESIYEIDGPPSSPFISQIAETNSRASSKQYYAQALPVIDQDANMSSQTPDDKENVRPVCASSPDARTRKPVLASATTSASLVELDKFDVERMSPPAYRSPKRSALQPVSQPNRLSPAKGSSPAGKVSLPSPPQHVRPLSRTHLDSTNVDDTCFSTFSEVHDLTWTKSARSPTRLADLSNSQHSPRKSWNTPQPSRKRSSPSMSPSPTPRRHKVPDNASEASPTFLIDFTEQIENIARPNALPGSRTAPNLLQYLHNQRSPEKPTRHSLATPAKPNSILDILDFELPPAPTPRSIPTITVRELETLKSQYLSQISSLKATLNGREAEVESLKRAIGGAERRVGEAQEALREEKSRREQAEQEKLDWERRGMEVENVLQTVREEILKADAEKEELVNHAGECERRAEEAESRVARLEERLGELEAVQAMSNGTIDGLNADEQVQRLVAMQIDSKIEAVSRELHAVYKEKHERKVATLKQSYEARSQKRMAELQAKADKLERANDELLVAKAALVPLPTGDDGDNTALAALRTQMEEQKALVARVQQELSTSKGQRDELLRALEQERIEKGDLVAAVDEMLALQAEQGASQAAMSVVEDFRKSISRPPSSLGTSLRQPTETKIARAPQYSRTPAGKSKMLANIERMGRSALYD